MRLARFLTFVSGAFLLLASATLFLFRSAPTASAQTTTPPSSTISSTTGPLAWDFAPVGGGTAPSPTSAFRISARLGCAMTTT